MKKFIDDNGLLYFLQKIVNVFVKKDGNKVLSDNNYTTEEKNKLAGLNNYTLPKASSNSLGGIKVGAGLEVSEDGTLSATGGGTADAVDWDNVLNKPTKVSEFQNDSGFQTATQVQTAIQNATQDFATEEYVNNKVSTAYKYKGSVANQSALPDNAEAGAVYNLEDTGMNVAWDGTKWDNLGMIIDLSGYVKEEDLKAVTNQEIDVIVSSVA